MTLFDMIVAAIAAIVFVFVVPTAIVFAYWAIKWKGFGPHG